jgi:hypothetical protein
VVVVVVEVVVEVIIVVRGIGETTEGIEGTIRRLGLKLWGMGETTGGTIGDDCRDYRETGAESVRYGGDDWRDYRGRLEGL